MIHELSRRSTAKFQAVNCAALPDTLFESEIFGYEKGAFTGAHDRKPGRLELANEGTLFLDEIGDMSLIAQAKLLRVLEERRFERLGGQQIDLGRLPSDLGDQPAARTVRARRPVPRGPLLPRQRVRDPAAVAARAAGRHPGARAAVPRALLRRAGAAARQQEVLARSARPVPGLPVARQHPRARKHRLARGAVGAGPDDSRHRHRVPARNGCRPAQPSAIACRRSPRPSARTSSASSKRCSGTRRKRRASSISAAGRSTGRSSNISSSPRGAAPRGAFAASKRRSAELALALRVHPVRRCTGDSRPDQRQTRRAGHERKAADPPGIVAAEQLHPCRRHRQARRQRRARPNGGARAAAERRGRGVRPWDSIIARWPRC